ncbi:NACHT domain-containing protein [Streptomyces sp. NPDC101209]|uniref:NACHT domain-containing protein n=1 Tax=Streptomyces sp. NPDC101209 TaxID=3366129 RepID=UPI0038084D3A
MLNLQGWLPAAAAFVLGVLVLKLKDWAKRLVDLGADLLYRRLAGSALLRRTALRRYTIKIYRQHCRFPVYFRPDEHLAMDMDSVYVPVTVASGFGTDAERRDAEIALRDIRQAIVLGDPGAGKTILLRHTVFVWARERYDPWSESRTWYDPRSRPRVELGALVDIPVLLPLHSVDLDTGDLGAQIARYFAEYDFPNARTWVERALEEGKLAVYFDGLDEVPTAQRARVAGEIRRFMRTYDRCRVVVTCRVAVYRGEFGEEAIPLLKVEGFDDRHIQQFLHAWSWPPVLAPDTVEQLLSALRDTPQLMPLARNPLLLTLIANLYSFEYAGTGQALPHSRADFYDQVTVSLLRDHQRDARFAPPVKRSALQRLALAAQDVLAGAYDRLAIPLEKVLPVLREVLEQYGRSVDSAEDMLAEIVDRSGLLLSLDNGERYQFAHLTLQEYLAATALADQPDLLLQRYRQDPEIWRETVRLWCGLVTQDCSPVVRAILRAEPLLAFQCLADAQMVDDALADEIVTMFRARLTEPAGGADGAAQDAVVAAFGLVAADRRPHGRAVFELLRETAEDSSAPQRAQAAVHALAATRLPQAARYFASQLAVLPDALDGLVSMGDLTVAALKEAGPDLPVGVAAKALWTIRTPSAISALGDLLEGAIGLEDPEPSWEVAFRLADLLRDSQAAAAMRFSGPLRRRFWWHWSWVKEPYNKPWLPPGTHMPYPFMDLSQLICILAALLSAAASAGFTPPGDVTPDPRIVVPLALVDPLAAQSRALRLKAEDLDALLRADLDQVLGGNGMAAQLLHRHGLAALGRRLNSEAAESRRSSEGYAALGRRVMAAAGLPPARLRLLEWLPAGICRNVVEVLASNGIAHKDAWESGARLLTYDFASKFGMILPLYMMLSIAPCSRVAAAFSGHGPWGVQGWLGIIFLALAAGSMVFLLFGGVPLRRLWSWTRPAPNLRLAFWVWVAGVLPLTCCIAMAEWWGTWRSFMFGLLFFVGVIWLIRPLASRQALTDLLNDDVALLVESLESAPQITR